MKKWRLIYQNSSIERTLFHKKTKMLEICKWCDEECKECLFNELKSKTKEELIEIINDQQVQIEDLKESYVALSHIKWM